jgi:uncharacterized protein YjbI with pentapeptide repeats
MDETTSEKPEIKAKDNQWYLLATLYGQPEEDDEDLQARNRTVWNRYMVTMLTDKQRALWIEEGLLNATDITPFSPEELSDVEKAFSERHRQANSTASEKLLPLESVSFSHVVFADRFWAAGFFFPGSTDFRRAIFVGTADFRGAIFPSFANFQGATINRANFRDATINQGDFRGVTFSIHASFKGATIRHAVFENAKFSAYANFERATISRNADFQGATFSQEAVFMKATFSRDADFQGATFARCTFFDFATFDRRASFVNVDMKDQTSFEYAKFKYPPIFVGAKLHEGTIWRGVTWPKPPKETDQAGPFVDAYERLKLEMDRLKKHEDELLFFALEMQSRRVLNGPIAGIPIALYSLLCDYGRSYVLPLCWLLLITAVGVPLFWWHFVLWNFWQSVTLSNFWQSAVLSILSNFWQAIGLSLANTFGVLGLRKDLIAAEVIESLPGSLKVISAAQTVAGIVLLFLLGLAIRNRFRMK